MIQTNGYVLPAMAANCLSKITTPFGANWTILMNMNSSCHFMVLLYFVSEGRRKVVP